MGEVIVKKIVTPVLLRMTNGSVISLHLVHRVLQNTIVIIFLDVSWGAQKIVRFFAGQNQIQ